MLNVVINFRGMPNPFEAMLSHEHKGALYAIDESFRE
jgi:hypothetical protein